jgi:hypothetical protein
MASRRDLQLAAGGQGGDGVVAGVGGGGVLAGAGEPDLAQVAHGVVPNVAGDGHLQGTAGDACNGGRCRR